MDMEYYLHTTLENGGCGTLQRMSYLSGLLETEHPEISSLLKGVLDVSLDEDLDMQHDLISRVVGHCSESFSN